MIEQWSSSNARTYVGGPAPARGQLREGMVKPQGSEEEEDEGESRQGHCGVVWFVLFWFVGGFVRSVHGLTQSTTMIGEGTHLGAGRDGRHELRRVEGDEVVEEGDEEGEEVLLDAG